MEPIIMQGKAVAESYRVKIEAKIAAAKEKGQLVTLAIICVGADAASKVYKNRLVKLAESMGAQTISIELPATTSQKKVLDYIAKLNEDEEIYGILPLMPMPSQIDEKTIGAAVAPEKDVDCLNPFNCGLLYLGRSRWAPCTPRACMAILSHYGISLTGKHVVVLGRSNVVGKPVALLLVQENATVTICHSKTQYLADILKEADVIIAAVGRPGFVKPSMVKEGVIIVDVGINVVDNTIVGDVDGAVAAKSSAYTPVPGGVGTVCNLMVMEMLSRNLPEV